MNPSASSQSRRGARVLYLSYDGMCDPLGASQVLPYLGGLAERGHRITLISFEKRERSVAEREVAARACSEAGIDWRPLAYHKHPPILSAIYDMRRMRKLAERLHRAEAFDLIHCRSYLPALVGLRMKRRHGVRFVFDMRGFWADERVDGGIWDLGNPLLKAVHAFFKRREGEFLREADQIVSLTEAGERVLLARRGEPGEGPPITVIPCCTDFAAFPPVTAGDRAAARARLGIGEGGRVAVYLGSVGSWYLVDEMFDFFRVQVERDPGAVFLIVTRDTPEPIIAAAARRGIARERLIIRPASRAEVPGLVAAADYALFFIKPVFSKSASSPTKMGEFLSLELPMVTNGGVGDVARIMDEAGAGTLVERFDKAAYADALDRIEALEPDMTRWREASRRWFDLELGVDRYDGIYQACLKGEPA